MQYKFKIVYFGICSAVRPFDLHIHICLFEEKMLLK